MFPLARRFVAGTTVGDAMSVVDHLHSEGFLTTVDYLGEDVTSVDEASRVVETYERLLGALSLRKNGPNVSVKLSALGLLIDEELALRNLLRILRAASAFESYFVRIDMEGSQRTDATLRVFRSAYLPGFSTGPVIQAYLRRSGYDVDELLRIGARVRLCKGAYNEPYKIAFKRKAEVHSAYLDLASWLLQSGKYPAFATHDPAMIRSIKRMASVSGRANETFEFQMLYGVKPALQRSLVREGYRVRVYVPFGIHWLPYFRRRVLERRENMLFALSAVFSR
jgi:proline dehydrogenase